MSQLQKKQRWTICIFSAYLFYLEPEMIFRWPPTLRTDLQCRDSKVMLFKKHHTDIFRTNHKPVTGDALSLFRSLSKIKHHRFIFLFEQLFLFITAGALHISQVTVIYFSPKSSHLKMCVLLSLTIITHHYQPLSLLPPATTDV